MSTLPKLAIVGRPNVGKSALFNCICKKRIAIVDEAEGITRDRLYSEAELFGRPFMVIDTGGIDPRSKAPFNEQVKQQAEVAIEEADTLVMVVDSQTGPTELDYEVARLLLRTNKPLCLAVNKVDHPDKEWEMHEFLSLGIHKMVAVSGTQRWHIAELLETALNPLPIQEETEEQAHGLKVAIIGRPNVGKSSLLNYLLQEERCIVSPLPGTTRDSIDIPFDYHGKPFTLIDTAGIRRKAAEKEVVDKFAYLRTERAIERADVCLLMLDAQQGMTTQEKRIATMIEEAGKGCILLFNKWDLVKGFRMEHCLQSIEEDVPFLKHCPKIFMSALTGRNVEKIFDQLEEVANLAKTRITTHQLNKFIEGAMQRRHPAMIQGKRLRVYYMAQVGIQPPTFVLFVNYPNLMMDSYKKYLINQFREEYSFSGSPLRFYLRGKKKVELEERLALPKKTKEQKPKNKKEMVQEFDDSEEFDDFEDNFDENDFLLNDESWK